MNYSKYIKIILSGLDAAGKTSLLVAFKRLYEYEDEVLKLKPTTQIEHYRRSYLNSFHIDINDMGGQSTYRERYLKRKIYFEEIDALLYLIDIRIKERFEESLDYLSKVLYILNEVEYNKEQDIFIIFSKMDSGKSYTELPEYIENLNYLEEEIQKRFPSFKFKFFATSIYNVYSVIRVFSEALNRKISNYSQIEQIISDFAKKYNLLNVILFDHTGLIIYEYPHLTPVFGNGQVVHSAQMEYMISSNLEYFAKVENKEATDFKFFGYIEDNLITYGYVFFVDDDPNQRYYISILTDKSNPKKEDWNTFELADKCKEFIKNIK
ncbi:MAG: ADP-ribosylation factor-like protein [Promethearchaeota archaeon]